MPVKLVSILTGLSFEASSPDADVVNHGPYVIVRKHPFRCSDAFVDFGFFCVLGGLGKGVLLLALLFLPAYASQPYAATLLVALTGAVMVSVRSIFWHTGKSAPDRRRGLRARLAADERATFLPVREPGDIDSGGPAVKWMFGAMLSCAGLFLPGFLAVKVKRPYPTLQTQTPADGVSGTVRARCFHLPFSGAGGTGEGIVDFPTAEDSLLRLLSPVRFTPAKTRFCPFPCTICRGTWSGSARIRRA